MDFVILMVGCFCLSFPMFSLFFKNMSYDEIWKPSVFIAAFFASLCGPFSLAIGLIGMTLYVCMNADDWWNAWRRKERKGGLFQRVKKWFAAKFKNGPDEHLQVKPGGLSPAAILVGVLCMRLVKDFDEVTEVSEHQINPRVSHVYFGPKYVWANNGVACSYQKDTTLMGNHYITVKVSRGSENIGLTPDLAKELRKAWDEVFKLQREKREAELWAKNELQACEALDDLMGAKENNQ